jgi:hypothetical protein
MENYRIFTAKAASFYSFFFGRLDLCRGVLGFKAELDRLFQLWK